MSPLPGGISRRKMIGVSVGGLAGVAAVSVGGAELIAHKVLPGGHIRAQIEGTCSVLRSTVQFAPPGPTVSGRFYSRARQREVGYTIAYPPGHGPGSEMPLIIGLHAYGRDHTNVLSRMSATAALSMIIGGQPLRPMAFVSADGGNGYWNPHPGDDPLAMIVDELIPRCHRLGLGLERHDGGVVGAGPGAQPAPLRIGAFGISMGGYGALLLAEKYPHLIGAVSAISPAIWTTYEQARSANAGAYASAAAFTDADVVTHATALAGVAVRIALGNTDPFVPGLEALAEYLPHHTTIAVTQGCHTEQFFASQQPLSMIFFNRHLTW